MRMTEIRGRESPDSGKEEASYDVTLQQALEDRFIESIVKIIVKISNKFKGKRPLT